MTNQPAIEIKAKARKQGKHTSRALRRANEIPAVVYGPNVENINIAIAENDAVKYSRLAYENSIFQLKSDDSKVNNLKVIKKMITHHPVSHRPVHLDFYALDMKATIKVNVELKYTGHPVGVTEGGLLQELRRDVEVECLATEIPESFEVDVTELKVGDTLHASDIKMLESIKLVTSEQEAIVSVVQQKEEKEEEGTPAVTEGDAAPAVEANTDKKE